jgi:hypothetical protein
LPGQSLSTGKAVGEADFLLGFAVPSEDNGAAVWAAVMG